MHCVRCEIVRAKLWAIAYWNLGYSVGEIASKLHAKEDGLYSVRRNEILRFPPNARGATTGVIIFTAPIDNGLLP